MQLTRFTDLGLRVVVRLIVAAEERPVGTREIAAQINVSYAHAAKVVTRLSELGVVSARRGRHGGLMITELGRTASVGWLARRLEGQDEVIVCEGDQPCPLRGGCRLRAALREAQAAFYAVLDDVAVVDLATPQARAILLDLMPTTPSGRNHPHAV